MSNGKYSGRKKASESAHKILVVTRIFIFIWILFIWMGSDAIQNEWKQLQMQLLGRLYRSEMVKGSEGELIEIFLEDGTEEDQKIGKEMMQKSGYGSLAYKYMKKMGINKIFLITMSIFGVTETIAGIFLYHKVQRYGEEMNQIENARNELLNEQWNSQKEKKMMAKYMENIAHQIKTPLAGITLCQEYLEETEEDSARRKMLAECRSKVESIQLLVQQLMMSARLNARSVKMKLEHVTAETLRERVYLVTDYLKELKQIEILWDYHPEDEIFCDCFWVQEAIINLIRNAAGYTPSGGFIHISIKQPKDSRTEIMVCDSGEGIPEERWKDIFRRFYTSSVTETGASAGIGLNLAYEIVTVHGGLLELVPHEGAGAWFRITLYQ